MFPSFSRDPAAMVVRIGLKCVHRHLTCQLMYAFVIVDDSLQEMEDRDPIEGGLSRGRLGPVA